MKTSDFDIEQVELLLHFLIISVIAIYLLVIGLLWNNQIKQLEQKRLWAIMVIVGLQMGLMAAPWSISIGWRFADRVFEIPKGGTVYHRLILSSLPAFGTILALAAINVAAFFLALKFLIYNKLNNQDFKVLLILYSLLWLSISIVFTLATIYNK